jgi:large subunit ribosomal protein L21
MYAVIETGGKQYRVEVGTELEVELLDVEPGKTITIERVLLVADGDESSIGRPLVADAAVSAEVLDQTRGPKLISFKYRPKARSRVKKGHRQELTVLRIADITFGGKSAAKAAQKAERDARTERERLEEAAATQAAKDAELASKLAVGAEAKPTKAKAQTATKAKTETKVTAEPKSKAKTEAASKAKADSKTSTPTRSAARATTSSTESKAKADSKTTASKPAAAKTAPKAKPDAPKKPRATKKDE